MIQFNYLNFIQLVLDKNFNFRIFSFFFFQCFYYFLTIDLYFNLLNSVVFLFTIQLIFVFIILFVAVFVFQIEFFSSHLILSLIFLFFHYIHQFSVDEEIFLCFLFQYIELYCKLNLKQLKYHARKDFIQMNAEEVKQLKTLFAETEPFNKIESLVNSNEYQVCMLVRIGLTPSDICILTGLSQSNISNIRKRLLTKLSGRNGSSKDFDAYIMNL